MKKPPQRTARVLCFRAQKPRAVALYHFGQGAVNLLGQDSSHGLRFRLLPYGSLSNASGLGCLLGSK